MAEHEAKKDEELEKLADSVSGSSDDAAAGTAPADDAPAPGAHFAAGSSHARTRDELEGAVAHPVSPEAESLDELTSSRAESLRPSVARHARAHDRYETALREEARPSASSDGRRRVPLAAKILIGLVAVLAVVAVAAGLWVRGLDSAMSVDEDQREELEGALVDPEPATAEEDRSFYVLILGSDAREADEISRADVIMLARVDTARATVTLVSIPRDTMVQASNGGTEKINASYNYGPAFAVRAVSEFAGVDIAHYVEVDFEGLEQVVDALGGVTVTIPEDIPAGNGGTAFSAGEQTLTGEQALSYARERYNVSGGDFGRAQAQRQIVEAIVRQVLAASPVQIPGLVGQLASSVSTDLSSADIASYALEIQRSGESLTIYSAAAPSYSLSQGGVSYVATMYDEWRAMMRRVDAGLDPSDSSAEIPQEQAEDERLGAATNAAGPRDYRALAESAALTTEDVATVE